jgi:NADH-quinone oxidoreductase subunit L
MGPLIERVNEQPGLLFVAATLLPLGSFVLLLLLGALRWSLRPYAKENPTIDSAFQFLGGNAPGRGPAIFATVAIGLSFVCSLTGFVWFLNEVSTLHHYEHDLRHAYLHPPHKIKGEEAKFPAQVEKHRAEVIDLVGSVNTYKSRWQGAADWARVYSTESRDPKRASLLTVGFRIDMLAAVMFVMVSFVATLIHLFSIGYMADELKPSVEDHEVHTAHGHYERRGRFGRFFMFLSLFCFSMFNLMLADNLFQVFVSWELVGICSYLLIGFYFERTSASNASNKAFITNRVGDAGFIIGLLIFWTYLGTLNFEEMFAMVRAPHADAHGQIKLADNPDSLDAQGVIKVGGRAVGDQILRGKIIGASESGYRFWEANPDGDEVLLFPRVMNMDPQPEGHFDGPVKEQPVYDSPGARSYGHMPYWLLVVAGLGIFLGCVGKSAQFPLQVWLPDAMEGPTPVSALIHAATMVAAGVYLVGRSYPLFTPEVLLTIAYVGAITLFVAATIAIVMTDIKKVLAYSTVSQLGYMMLALGVGGWTAGLLHLLTHAFFKALLFLGSGSVIYGCHHQQDMLKMGGLYPKMKITAITMLMGVLAISGIPLFSGWYSKDEILAAAFGFAMVHKHHFLLFVLPLATAGITTFYMFRMWFMTFKGRPRDEHVYEHAHESPWPMTAPLILLAILSVGVAWGWPLHEPEKSWLGHQLHHYSQPKTVEQRIMRGSETLVVPVDVDFVKENSKGVQYHSFVGLLALAVVAVGLVFASGLYLFGWMDPAEAKEQFPGVHRFLLHKWYFDEVYSALIVRPGLAIAHWCRNFDTYVIDAFVNLLGKWNLFVSYWSGRFDRGIIDGFVNVVADASYGVGYWLRNVQTGYLRSYVLFLALAAVALTMILYAWVSALAAG